MLTVVLLSVACAVALVDWWAVGTDRRSIERLAKPMTMGVLVLVAAAAGDAPADVRSALVVGAIFGLVGDIALLDEGETSFMIGLGSFAVGHLAYAVAALLVGFDVGWAAAGLGFVVALLAFRFVTRTLPGARDHGGQVLAGAVVFYAAVISLMVTTSFATTITLAALGAALFAVSDWVLGYQRFVGPLPGRRLAVMMPYHVGQALLILGLATA